MTARVEDWVGTTLDNPPGDVVCERGYILSWLEATENENPLYWQQDPNLAPPSMLSVWMRPLTWKPGGRSTLRPLELHFRLKEAFGLPDGIVNTNEIVFGEPVRVGDRIRTSETITEVSDEEVRKLGRGRFWTIDVTYRNQRDEVVAVETYRMFSYRGGA